MKNRHTG